MKSKEDETNYKIIVPKSSECNERDDILKRKITSSEFLDLQQQDRKRQVSFKSASLSSFSLLSEDGGSGSDRDPDL